MKVQKISICLGLLFILGIGNFAMAENNEVKKSTAMVKKDYKIQISKNKEGKKREIRFLSPDGKIIRTLPYRGRPYKTTVVSKNNKHILYRPEEYIGQVGRNKFKKQGYLNYNISLYDKKGEIKWKKEFKTYPKYLGIEGVENPFDNGISDNGRTYVNYCDENGIYTLKVFNENGKEIVIIKHNRLLYGIEMSPDGKILGAEVYQDGKYLFFIEVDTGKTKLVKAEGDGWSGTFLVKFSNPKPINQSKIYLNVTLKNEYKKINDFKVRKTFRRYVDFNKLPEDMLELIQGE